MIIMLLHCETCPKTSSLNVYYIYIYEIGKCYLFVHYIVNKKVVSLYNYASYNKVIKKQQRNVSNGDFHIYNEC